MRGFELRPTADRLRETLFDVLTAGEPDALVGSLWVDLFAGTGAVGIEAISRGADRVYFVEAARQAAELIGRNLASLGIGEGFELLNQDAVRGLHGLELRNITADYVFLDPPYGMEGAYRQTLEEVSSLRLLKADSRVIAEHRRKFEPGDSFGQLRRYRRLEQGDAALSFYRLA